MCSHICLHHQLWATQGKHFQTHFLSSASSIEPATWGVINTHWIKRKAINNVLMPQFKFSWGSNHIFQEVLEIHIFNANTYRVPSFCPWSMPSLFSSQGLCITVLLLRMLFPWMFTWLPPSPYRDLNLNATSREKASLTTPPTCPVIVSCFLFLIVSTSVWFYDQLKSTYLRLKNKHISAVSAVASPEPRTMPQITCWLPSLICMGARDFRKWIIGPKRFIEKFIWSKMDLLEDRNVK